MKRELQEKLEAASHMDLTRWISWIVVGACVALSAVLAVYIATFSGGLSSSAEAWGQFGDFFGGVANPLLTFLTVVALALTLILQNRQLAVSARELALSRAELELTRQELGRSARAQEASERALSAQAHTAEQSAKLTAVNFLLEHYRSEINSMQGHAYISGSSAIARLQELRRRKAVLEVILDSLFNEVTSEG